MSVTSDGKMGLFPHACQAQPIEHLAQLAN